MAAPTQRRERHEPKLTGICGHEHAPPVMHPRVVADLDRRPCQFSCPEECCANRGVDHQQFCEGWRIRDSPPCKRGRRNDPGVGIGDERVRVDAGDRRSSSAQFPDRPCKLVRLPDVVLVAEREHRFVDARKKLHERCRGTQTVTVIGKHGDPIVSRSMTVEELLRAIGGAVVATDQRPLREGLRLDRLDQLIEERLTLKRGEEYLDVSVVEVVHRGQSGALDRSRVEMALLHSIRKLLDRFRWPRRRARLPGRGRLRELARDPRRTLKTWTPARQKHMGRVRDKDRLVGLLMIRNEADILDEMLACATRWFDRILVLDGTNGEVARARTDEILDGYSEVVLRMRDEELGHQVRDGARQYLLEECRARYGVDNWIGVLHADEFMDQDPRPMLASHHPRRDPSIRVRVTHTFLHTDDKRSWETIVDQPIRTRVQHLMWPGVPEARFFFDAGDRDYETMRHGKVIPTSFRNGPLVDGFVITQYNERSPELLIERAAQREQDTWQTEHYGRLDAGFDAAFTDTLDLPGTPFAPEFRGDPEGPFRATHRSAIPTGPLAATPPPIVHTTSDSSQGRPTAVDLPFVTEPGGLLEILQQPGRRATWSWARRMRGEWRAAATGGDMPGYEALVRYTESTLRSARTTDAQRARVGGELVRRLHDRLAPVSGWETVAPAELADPLRLLLSVESIHLETPN